MIQHKTPVFFFEGRCFCWRTDGKNAKMPECLIKLWVASFGYPVAMTASTWEITTSGRELTTVAQEISTLSQEMNAATWEISTSTQEITATSQELTVSTREMTTPTRETTPSTWEETTLTKEMPASGREISICGFVKIPKVQSLWDCLHCSSGKIVFVG